jgi:hypothetical protein
MEEPEPMVLDNYLIENDPALLRLLYELLKEFY